MGTKDVVCLIEGVRLRFHYIFVSGHAALFATLIARTAKDIDFLIESLPSEECSPALQVTIICQGWWGWVWEAGWGGRVGLVNVLFS